MGQLVRNDIAQYCRGGVVEEVQGLMEEEQLWWWCLVEYLDQERWQIGKKTDQ